MDRRSFLTTLLAEFLETSQAKTERLLSLLEYNIWQHRYYLRKHFEDAIQPNFGLSDYLIYKENPIPPWRPSVKHYTHLHNNFQMEITFPGAGQHPVRSPAGRFLPKTTAAMSRECDSFPGGPIPV